MYIILVSYVQLPVAYVSSSVLTFLKHFVFLFFFIFCFFLKVNSVFFLHNRVATLPTTVPPLPERLDLITVNLSKKTLRIVVLTRLLD